MVLAAVELPPSNSSSSSTSSKTTPPSSSTFQEEEEVDEDNEEGDEDEAEDSMLKMSKSAAVSYIYQRSTGFWMVATDASHSENQSFSWDEFKIFWFFSLYFLIQVLQQYVGGLAA